MTDSINLADSVLAEVAVERQRQDAKWGEQNHPDGTGQYPETIDADVARMVCQQAAEGGYLDWLHILREEVAEAFAEPDPVKLRAELIQVAAVAIAWIEAIDRRTAPTGVACCTLAPGHDGPCVWDCSNCSGTSECPDCADAVVIFAPCSTCQGTGGCPVCNKAGQFVDALPEPRPVVTVVLDGGDR